MEIKKKCTTCLVEKELGEFNKNKKGKFGVEAICRLCKNKYAAEYREGNKDKIVKRDAKYRKDNKEKIARRNAVYIKENAGMNAAKTAKRRSSKLQATPLWITPDHLKEISELYELAQDLRWINEEPLHVDHIIPLQGETVSGLHVPWNLQILTASTNLSKSNNLV